MEKIAQLKLSKLVTYYMCLGAVSYLICKYLNHNLEQILSWDQSWFYILGLASSSVVILVLLHFLFETLFKSYHAHRSFLGALAQRTNAYGLVGVGILSAVCEELLFRGGLQPHLGVVVTALLISLFHISIAGIFTAWSSFVLLISLLQGIVFAASGSLYPSLCIGISFHLLVFLPSILTSKSRA